jgi:exodeoxyribonuclease VII large subunit
MAQRAQRLDDLTYRLLADYRTLLHAQHRRLEIAAARVRHFDFRRGLAATRSRLESGTETLVRAFRSYLAGHRSRLDRFTAEINALSPVRILERGYALVFDSNGALVKDAAQLAPGAEISASLARGSFTAEVKETRKD